MLVQTKTVLNSQNKLCCSPEFMTKTIGKFVLSWKEEKFASCKVLKDRRYETWLKDLLRIV